MVLVSLNPEKKLKCFRRDAYTRLHNHNNHNNKMINEAVLAAAPGVTRYCGHKIAPFYISPRSESPAW